MTGPRDAPRSWIGRDLPPIRRDGRDYFLVSHGGALFLVHNHCPHRGGPLKFGYVDGRERIVCPLHGNAFAIARLVRRPSTIALRECAGGGETGRGKTGREEAAVADGNGAGEAGP